MAIAGNIFATRVFAAEWEQYLAELGISCHSGEWLCRSMAQAYDVLPAHEQELLNAAYYRMAVPVFDTAVWPLRYALLYDAVVELYHLQRLSVASCREVLELVVTQRKAILDDYQKCMDPLTAALPIVEDTVIDVTGLSGTIIDRESLESSLTPLYNKDDVQQWEQLKLGQQYREKLGLDGKEVIWLDKFYDPCNAFLEIKGCCVATIRLYLAAVRALRQRLESVGLSFITIWNELFEIIYPGYDHTENGFVDAIMYQRKEVESQIYLCLFRRAEVRVRDAYAHKRKITDKFYYTSAATYFEQRIGEPLNTILNELQARILPPDAATEVALNRSNVNRWKLGLDRIKAVLNSDNYTEQAALLEALGAANIENPAVEQIYFEASKMLVAYDKQVAIAFYLRYVYADLHSPRIDRKPLGKGIQKNLFASQEQCDGFTRIVNQLVFDKNLEAALSAANELYKPGRRKITIDRGLLEQTRNELADTVDVLGNILNAEDEPESEDAVIDLKLNPVAIPAKAEDFTFYCGLLFSEHQSGLLDLFRSHEFIVSNDMLNEYTSQHKLFKNQLVESINELCYDQLDDLLIEESEDGYEVNRFYFQKITNLC